MNLIIDDWWVILSLDRYVIVAFLLWMLMVRHILLGVDVAVVVVVVVDEKIGRCMLRYCVFGY